MVATSIENDKKAPFTVGFLADIQGGTPPYDVTWDFDSDSATDGFGVGTATTFASAGDFQVTVRVKDASNTVAADVLGGQVPLGVVDVPSAIANVKAGKIRALAVTSKLRIVAAPEVPTMTEGGVAGFDQDLDEDDVGELVLGVVG